MKLHYIAFLFVCLFLKKKSINFKRFNATQNYWPVKAGKKKMLDLTKITLEKTNEQTLRMIFCIKMSRKQLNSNF